MMTYIQQNKTTILWIVHIPQLQALNTSYGFFFIGQLQNTSMIKPKADNNFIWSSTKSRHQVHAKIHKAVPPQGSLSMPRHSCTDSPRLAQQLDTSINAEMLRKLVQIFKYFSSTSIAVFKRNNPPQNSA